MFKNTTKDFYYNDDQQFIFTASYHLKRGHCCKSFCLHCPFGTTLEKFGLVLKKIKNNHLLELRIKETPCGFYDSIKKELKLMEDFEQQGIQDFFLKNKQNILKQHTSYEDKGEQ